MPLYSQRQRAQRLYVKRWVCSNASLASRSGESLMPRTTRMMCHLASQARGTAER